MNLTTEQFKYLSDLLAEQIGMALEPDQSAFVEGRLRSVAQQHGHSRLDQTIAALRGSNPRGLLQDVCESLTTHETSFFRDGHYFDELADRVLPKLIAARASDRKLVIWCAACSTGQEPYSLAMLLQERFTESLRGWNVSIRATDFSKRALEKARSGQFTDVEINRGLTAARQSMHFRRASNGWQISEQLRSLIRFEQLNLIGPWPRTEPADLVLLRNVLIYMTPTARQRVIEQLERNIQPSGQLMLGSTESVVSASVSCIRPSGR